MLQTEFAKLIKTRKVANYMLLPTEILKFKWPQPRKVACMHMQQYKINLIF